MLITNIITIKVKYAIGPHCFCNGQTKPFKLSSNKGRSPAKWHLQWQARMSNFPDCYYLIFEFLPLRPRTFQHKQYHELLKTHLKIEKT